MKARLASRGAISVLAAAVLAACQTNSNLPPGVTQQSVRSLSLGMAREEVVRRLGAPVSEKPTSYWPPDPSGIPTSVMAYSSRCPDPWCRYPMLWVHLRGAVVSSVYAKRHAFWASEGIYVHNEGLHWESPLFERYFPR